LKDAPLLSFLGFLAALTAAFFFPLRDLARHALGSELHSYVLLIPFVAAYLIYLKRDRLPNTYDGSPGWAALPALAGTAALVVVWLLRRREPAPSVNDVLTLQTLAFVSWTIAGGFVFLGRSWVRTLAFPLAFLMLMIPLPDQAVDSLETGSKLASAEVAGLLFKTSGVPVFREGLVFHLPGVSMEVAQECSGIRSSLVLMITALLAAHLFLSTTWRQALFLAFVIPLGILRNGFRILVLGLLSVYVSPEVLHSFIHNRGGPVFFVLSLIPLGAVLWWLMRGERRSRPV
jgi:exosortase C (VPDSG-CTERM-specific)